MKPGTTKIEPINYFYNKFTQYKLQSIIDNIKLYKDWPIEGVDFIDIMPILKEPDAYRLICNQMAELAKKYNPNIIMGIEARGFLFGPQIALQLNLPFVCARKPGKLPGKLYSDQINNEYNISKLEIQVGSVRDKNVVIIDDVIATGNTIDLCESLIFDDNGNFMGCVGLFDLQYINRSNKVNKLNMDSIFVAKEKNKFELRYNNA